METPPELTPDPPAERPLGPPPPTPHPLELVVTDDLRRSRLTVLLRLLLTIPHYIWLVLWGIPVFFAVVAAWFVALFTGLVPAGLHGFIESYVRYQTHVNAYLALAANPFPSFAGTPGYPIDLTVARPERQSRLTVLFRFFLAIPAFIFVSIIQWIGQVVTVIAWFVCLITGRMPKGLRDFLVYWLRFNAQTTGYLCLLTGRYPRFTYE